MAITVLEQALEYKHFIWRRDPKYPKYTEKITTPVSVFKTGTW
jgi:hypothetical protein